MPTTLEALLDPISPAEFREQYYGKRPLLVRGHPKKFADLCTWDDLNRLLNTSPYPQPHFQVASAGKREGSLPLNAILEKCRAGSSLVIDYIQHCDPKIAEFMRSLELDLGETLSAVLFMSQPSKAAVGKHYDRTDNFVLQIAGQKAWWVYDPTIERPLLEKEKDPLLPSPDEPLLECELNAGDLLYFPRGYWHHALAQTDLSLHLTFVIQAQTGIHFLRWLVEELTNDVHFRHELPLSLGEESEQQRELLQKHVAELGEIIGARMRDPKTIQSFVEHRIVSDRDTRRFKLPAQILKAPVTQMNVRRFSRPARQRFVLKDGPREDTVVLSVWGHHFEFPRTARPLIEFIVGHASFDYEEALAHAGELTEPGVLEVLDPLLREGILDGA